MAHWFLTPGELTILAPLVGAPVGAIITFWATTRTNKHTLTLQRQLADQTDRSQREMSGEALKAQRELERDQRLWDKRAEFYPDIIAKLQKRNLLFGDYILGALNEPETQAVRKTFMDFVYDNMARMVSWPDAQVSEMWTMYFMAHRHFDAVLGLLTDDQTNAALLALAANSRDYSMHYSANLIIALRAELKGEEAIFNPKPPLFHVPAFIDSLGEMTRKFTTDRPGH